MSTYALITGTLFRQAEEKTSSKTGRTFVSATLKVSGDAGDAEYWSTTTFSQSMQSELLRLNVGDALSVQGKARIELWQPRDGGEVKISRSLFVDAVLPLRPAPRKAKAAKAAPAQQSTSTTSTSTDPGLNDDVPF